MFIIKTERAIIANVLLLQDGSLCGCVDSATDL